MSGNILKQSPNRWRMPLIAWYALMLILLSGLGIKVYWDYQYESDLQAFEQDQQKKLNRAEDLLSRTVFLTVGITTDQIEQIFEIKQPLNLKYDEKFLKRRAVWVDHESGFSLVIEFDEHRKLLRFGTEFEPILNGLPFPSDSPAQRWMGRIADLMMPVAFIGTPVLLILYWSLRTKRGVLSFLLATLTVSSVVVWAMDPSWALISSDLIYNKRLLLGIAMLAISFGCFFFGGIRNSMTSPFACKNCGYDLVLNESGTCPECGALISYKQ